MKKIDPIQKIKDIKPVERGAKAVEGFKKFALKGNAFDLAVGVMIGGAFGKIVTSLVSDIITPLISVFSYKGDLKNLYIAIGPDKGTETLADAQKLGVPTLNYGMFLQNIIDFLIIALTIYVVVSQIERFRRKPASAEPGVKHKDCPFCYTQINEKATRCPHCTSKLD